MINVIQISQNSVVMFESDFFDVTILILNVEYYSSRHRPYIVLHNSLVIVLMIYLNFKTYMFKLLLGKMNPKLVKYV